MFPNPNLKHLPVAFVISEAFAGLISLYFRQFNIDFLLISTWKSILWSPFKSVILRKALLVSEIRNVKGLQLKDYCESPDLLFCTKVKMTNLSGRTTVLPRRNTFWKCLTFFINKSCFSGRNNEYWNNQVQVLPFFQMMLHIGGPGFKKKNEIKYIKSCLQHKLSDP